MSQSLSRAYCQLIELESGLIGGLLKLIEFESGLVEGLLKLIEFETGLIQSLLKIIQAYSGLSFHDRLPKVSKNAGRESGVDCIP